MSDTAADRLMRQHRLMQIARSKTAGQRIITAYAQVAQDITAELSQLERQIATAQAAGEPVSVSWLYRANRLQALQQQIQEAMARFGGAAERVTQQMMWEGAQSGADDAHFALQTMLNGVGLPPGITISFNRLNAAALEDAANNAFRYNRVAKGAGGNRVRAVSKLYRQLPQDMQQRAKRTLLYAVATGQHPSVTARRFQQQMGIARNQALMIARTEQLNAYRRSSIATYRANSDVTEGWKWLTGDNPCPFCAARANSIHPVHEEMETHPGCRCCASPVPMSLSAILAAFGAAA